MDPSEAGEQGSGRSPLRWLLSLTILSAFTLWTVWYIRANADQFAAIELTRASLLPIAGLYAIFAVVTLINGLFTREVLIPFGIRLSTAEWLSLTTLSQFANYFLPVRAGAGLRGLYLVRCYGIGLADFLIVAAVMFPMQLTVNGLLALLGMTLVATDTGHYDPMLIGFAAAVSLLGIAFFLVPLQGLAGRKSFPWRQLDRVRRGLDRLRDDRQRMAVLWSLWLLMGLVSVVQARLAFLACGHELPWAAALTYGSFKNLSGIASLTPGALGIVETMSIYIGGLLGYTTAQALVAQGLIRVAAISTTLALTPFAYVIIQSRLRSRPDTSPSAV